MKIFTVLVFSVMLSVSQFCKAQLLLGGDDKGFSFGYSNGANFPEGDFGKEDLSKLPLSRISGQDTNKLNGYAQGIQTSFHFDFYATYRLIPHLSVILSVSEDANTYDINTLNTQLETYYPLETVTTGDYFSIVQYLAGAYLNFPFSAKQENGTAQHHNFHLNPFAGNFSFELKVLTGLTRGNYPDLYFPGVSETTLYTFNEGSGFGYFVSAGFKYEIVDGIGIHLNMNYAGTTIHYPSYYVTVFTTNSFTPTEYNIPKTMAIGLLQISAGISIEL